MSDSKEYDQGWNAALRAAEQAVKSAPVFTKKDRGPAFDAENIRVLEVCRIQIEALRRL